MVAIVARVLTGCFSISGQASLWPSQNRMWSKLLPGGQNLTGDSCGLWDLSDASEVMTELAHYLTEKATVHFLLGRLSFQQRGAHDVAAFSFWGSGERTCYLVRDARAES